MRGNLSGFLQWRLNLLLCLAFGWKIAKIYIFLLGKLYYLFNNREKHLINGAVLQAIGSGSQFIDAKLLTKSVFYGILSHYYEKLFIAFEDHPKASEFLNRHVISNDLEILKDRLFKGSGVILVTGHYGAIEYLPVLLAINSLPTSMIAKFRSEQLKRRVYSQAKKYKINLINAENEGHVVRSAIRELRGNRILITQCDEIEEWRPSAERTISFLGRRTPGDRTIDVLRKRTGAEIVFGVLHRYSLNLYELILHGYEEILQLLNKPSTSPVGETMLSFLEKCVYASPEQWYQWKKFSETKTLAAVHRTLEKPAPEFILRPT